MNKEEIKNKIELYKIDLEFCRSSGYKEVAAELEIKIKELNELLALQNV